MHMLAFDTCFDGCSACVAELRDGDVRVLGARSERFEAGHAERLVPMIGEAMHEAAISFDSIRRIAVTIGPGTFTGTRIGIAAARALALATGAETVGVSSLAVMAEVARRKVDARLLAVAVDARRGEVYVEVFGPPGAADASGPALLPLDAAAQVGAPEPIVYVGSAAEAVAAIAVGAGRGAKALLPDLVPDAVALAALAARMPASELALVPLYLRPPDAKPQAGKAIARA